MHLADGNINAEYSVLPEGQDASVDKTVELMSEMAKGKWGARSPKVRALAINVINAARVANKDYYGMLEAIHNYVRDNIRYVKDPIGQETLSYPEETLFNSKAGDCDDLTIAEMALLGSLGLRSYPVVIGLEPNHFSHVYLHAEIPPGKHRAAGTTIAADPIMREWPLGKAAPADRVKAKKVYPHLAGLGHMNLNGYADGPSYFSPQDELEASQVPAVLKSRYVDTGSRGSILTTKRLTEWGDELDDMFNRNVTISPMQAAPAYDLYSRGPVTNRAEKVLTSYLHQAVPDRRISAPMQMRRGPKIVTVQDKSAPAKAPSVAPTVGELLGLSDYLSDLAPLARQAAQRHLVAGKGDPLHRAVAAAKLTEQRARKASGRVVRMRNGDGFMPGLGDMERTQLTSAAQEIEKLAHQVAAKAQALAEMCAGSSPMRREAMRMEFGTLAHMDCHLGVVDAVTEEEHAEDPYVDAEDRVNALTTVMLHPAFREASTFKARPAMSVGPKNPIHGTMPVGAIVRDQNGRVMFTDNGSDDLAGFSLKKAFSSVSNAAKKVLAAPKKAVKQVQKQVAAANRQVKRTVSKAGQTVKDVAKNKNLRKLALGVATGGASLLTEKTIHKPLQKLMNRGKGGAPAGGDAGGTQYTDANGNPISEAEYNRLMAEANAPVNTPTSTTPPSDGGYEDDGSIMPQPGESSYDPSASGAPVDEGFGPEDMGPAAEFESAAQDMSYAGGGDQSGGGFTQQFLVDESGEDPFAAQGAESAGEEPMQADEESEWFPGDDASEGSDETFAEEAEEFAPAPRRSRRKKSRSYSNSADLDDSAVDSDEYADEDNYEDGGEGEEAGTSEEPPIEGLPSFGGIGLGTLALVGVGAYLLTRKK